MKLQEFFKKVMFNIEEKIWQYRNKILFRFIRTEVLISITDKGNGKKLISICDVIKNKPLAELEVATYYEKPINNAAHYWLERYKAYK